MKSEEFAAAILFNSQFSTLSSQLSVKTSPSGAWGAYIWLMSFRCIAMAGGGEVFEKGLPSDEGEESCKM